MKRCISKIRDFLIYLWRTITKYACITIRFNKRILHIKRNQVVLKETDLSVDPSTDYATCDVCCDDSHSNIEGGIIHDTKPDSLLESSGNQEE